MKAVIFARVSTQEQEQDGHSIGAQINKLRDYCVRNDLQVIKEFEVVESSTRGDRPEFYKMIDFVKRQKSTIALVCDKVDRLQRSFTELPILDKLRRENKISLHFLDIGKLDSEANSQQISFYQMSVVMANAYTNAISDNVKRSVIHKLNNGECIQRAPVGYLNARDENGKSTVIVDKTRAPLVRELFKKYSTGTVSLNDLAEFSKEKGLSNTFGKGDKPLAKNVISALLKNPFYYGEMYVKKYDKFFPHKYEPLISKALFDECQRITKLRAQATNRPQATKTKKEFIFKGLIKCAVTGRMVSADRKEDKVNKNTYLITWDPENTHKKIYVPENIILDEVTNVFKSISVPHDILEKVTEHLQQSHEAEKEFHANKIVALKKEEEAIKAKINRLLDVYLENSVTEKVYTETQIRLDKQLSTVRTEIESYEEADSNFKQTLVTAFKLANKASQLFESSKTHEKRELVNFLFSNLALRGRKLEYSLRKPFDCMVNLHKRSSWLPGQDSNL
ncbi:TPA: recombinase family protein [Legionella pneumophila]